MNNDQIRESIFTNDDTAQKFDELSLTFNERLILNTVCKLYREFGGFVDRNEIVKKHAWRSEQVTFHMRALVDKGYCHMSEVKSSGNRKRKSYKPTPEIDKLFVLC